MRAVVTGAAGFIGSHLIEALLARGDEVVGIERPGASRGWVRGLPIAFRDIGVDQESRLAEAFEGAAVVFHLAGLTCARRPAEYYAVNTEGTARVFRAAASLGAGAPHVILASSLAAVGPCRGADALDPETVPYPLSHYGRSKLLAETVAHAFSARVPTTVLRLAAVYGPRERGILTLFRLVRRGVALTIGGWDRELSLLYVGDLVQALLAAATAEAAIGRTYCVAHPVPVSWRHFARAVGAALGRAPALVSVPALAGRALGVAAEIVARVRRTATILNCDKVREILAARWVCDPTRVMTELGFRPAYAVGHGVAETARWYAEAGWL